MRNRLLLGPCSRVVPSALQWSWGGRWFLMSEAPLYLVQVAALVQALPGAVNRARLNLYVRHQRTHNP